MILSVQLFAGAKEAMNGAESISIEVDDQAVASQVLKTISDQYPALASLANRSRLAVNDSYVADEQTIAPDSNLALIPPVSGG